MGRIVVLLSIALITTACTSTRLVLPAADVEVSGRWLGVWRGVGIMDEPRQDIVQLELVQDGARGRGRMVWSGTNAAFLPEAVKIAGPVGMPVLFAVTGTSVIVRHEMGARQLAVQLHVDGDDMIGQVVNGGVPATLRLTRETALAGTTMRERLGQLELDLGRERRHVTKLGTRLDGFDARLDGLGTRVDEVGSVAEDASSTARQAVTTAEESTAKAGAAAARLEVLEQNGRETAALASPTAGARRHMRSVVHTLDIRFGFNRADLDDAAETTLLDVVELLKTNPGLAAELEGYTDEIGSRAYNLGLSQRRVETVQRYMAQRGVSLGQIHLVGLGALNGAPEKRSANRRVTLKLITEQE